MLLRFLLIWQCFLRNFFFFFLGPLKPICFVHIRGGLFASISDPLSVTWGVRFTRVQISILPHCCNKAEFPTTFWYHHGDVFATQDFLGAWHRQALAFLLRKPRPLELNPQQLQLAHRTCLSCSDSPQERTPTYSPNH